MKEIVKNKVLRRLQIIAGQVVGLQKMVGQEKYCINILQQSSAIKNALSGVEDLVLENHLSTHVIEQIKSGQEQKAIQEIIKIYKLSKKKWAYQLFR